MTLAINGHGLSNELSGCELYNAVFVIHFTVINRHLTSCTLLTRQIASLIVGVPVGSKEDWLIRIMLISCCCSVTLKIQ